MDSKNSKLESLIHNMKNDNNIIMKGDINTIAINNTWSLHIDSLELEDIVSTIKKARCLLSNEWGSVDHIFYCWFDSWSGQLKFSSIPAGNDLPFGCKLNITNNIDEIVEMAIKDGSTGFIDMSEFEEIDFDEAFEDEDDDEYVLDVYCDGCNLLN